MKPAAYRRDKGFRGPLAATLSITAFPASAQTLESSLLSSAAPMAIATGALAFSVIAAFMALRLSRAGEAGEAEGRGQIAAMRAGLDEYEALLSAMPEVTVLWREADTAPRIFGETANVCGTDAGPDHLLDFRRWLPEEDAVLLARSVRELREAGQPFDMSLSSSDNRSLRAVGRPTGSGAALRLRMAARAPEPITDETADEDKVQADAAVADRQAARAILSLMQKPAWIRDETGRLVYTNAAYRTLAQQMGAAEAGGAQSTEIFASNEISRHLKALRGGQRAVKFAEPLNDFPEFELILFALVDGSAGYLGRNAEPVRHAPARETGHIGGVIDALGTPVAVFDADGRLEQFNRAYRNFWDFAADELEAGMTERAVLDKLRSRGQLPSVADYQGWRREHLKVYDLDEPREDTWHLPDGRTINYVAAPASAEGGVIYVFEDVTQQLRLESTNKALADVQRETLNALSEAVAVFSTNGRLKLYNPRLSEIWKLPINELEKGPHIDRLVQSCDDTWPEDGLRIWQGLKRNIVDLDPTRADTDGRIARSDGRLINYAAVRLPDGQTMLTFIDVTESANYERVLKERNDALVTADRLKDAFVQNVSYELRSPLTNIIGFADLLASDAFGPLNERQRQYTDYIRASSATLGLLIDNILDLTHVDAGIAALDLEEHGIAELVERARAGLAATFTATGDRPPINLVVSVPEGLPPFVADGKRVVQVLYNLLSNAARFCEPGSEVRLSVEHQGDWLRFLVEDDGVGVPEEIRAAMFQRFEGRAVEGRQRGAGLGLAIVKAFVQLHGGTVGIEAREPRGTRVTVTLPRDASATAAPTGTLDV